MDDLIRRSEKIEREAWKDLYRRAPRQLRSELGLEVEERAGVTFLGASGIDHLLLNRAIGLGSRGAPEASSVARAVAHYERRGIGRYWIHVGSRLRNSSLPQQLRALGVVPYPRSWMKFVRRSAPVIVPESKLRARPANPSDASRIAEVVAPAFDLPSDAGAIFTTALGRKDWHYFVAEDHDRVVAAAALYVHGRDALLAFAATDPSARRKGAQRMLMAARLNLAQRLGCDHTFTETGLPIPGETGSSYRNILRAGFDELYVRDNFAPEGIRWQKRASSDATERSPTSQRPSRKLRRVVARSGT